MEQDLKETFSAEKGKNYSGVTVGKKKGKDF